MIVKSEMKKLLRRAAAGVVCLFIIGAGFRLMFQSPEYVVLKEYESPDGEHLAELSYAAWGGWGYTYCFEKVTVRHIGDGPALSDPSEIYSGACYGRKPTDDPFVNWNDAGSLQITLYVARLEGEGYRFWPHAMPNGLKATLNLTLE